MVRRDVVMMVLRRREHTPDAAVSLFRGTEEWNSPVTDCGLADMMNSVLLLKVMLLCSFVIALGSL